MNETNIVADLIVATHETAGGIDRTTIILAIIQSLTLILTTVIALVTRVIWKDVNSGRTAMIEEVKSLNKQLTVVEKLNAHLESQSGGVSPPRKTI